MKAFRIVVDGQALGDLGVHDFGNAQVIVGFARVSGPQPVDYHLHIGGLSESDKNGVSWHYRWACPDIHDGSRIEIEIVDSQDCISPTRRYRSDHTIQESPFTEEEERSLRYQDYLHLKKEFET
jgi:hypothetical protein